MSIVRRNHFVDKTIFGNRYKNLVYDSHLRRLRDIYNSRERAKTTIVEKIKSNLRMEDQDKA